MTEFNVTDPTTSNHVTELLPWYLNGRLTAEEKARVAHHLPQCSHCTTELSVQEKIHAAINASSKVEIAPQPSFNKLWERIVDEDAAAASTLHHTASARRTHTSMIQPVRQWFVARWLASPWLASHWMPVALVTQSAVIAVLVGIWLVSHGEINGNTTDAYRTVTSAAVVKGTVIHAVFDDATRVGDIKDILIRSNLQVASGPTAAGVYSLSPVLDKSVNAREIVRTLRDDPRVRFAELSHE